MASALYWEHEVGDAVALNADRWVAEQHVVGRELAEERAVALAHHDRDEVDGHLIEQTEAQALPGDGASGDRDDAVARERLRMSDGGRDSLGHEGERCLGVCVDPVGRDPVRDDDRWGDVECVATLPALGHSNSVRPPASAPTEDTHRRQCSELGGERWTAKSPAGVGISTSPFCSQSNNRPMVLSCLATYPSSDMIACATTLPIMSSLPQVCCGPAGMTVPGEQQGLGEVQVERVCHLVEQARP